MKGRGVVWNNMNKEGWCEGASLYEEEYVYGYGDESPKKYILERW